MTTPPAFGSRLLGPADEAGPRLRGRVQILLTGSILVANAVGAAAVSILAGVVIPGVERLHGGGLTANLVAVPAYTVAAAVVGVVWGTRSVRAGLAWLFEDRTPGDAEQRETLRVPLHLLTVQATLWGLALVVFPFVEAAAGRVDVVKLDLVILLGGTVTCAAAYLLSELSMRPLAARALAAHPPDRLLVPGLAERSLLAWGLGSAVPAAGLIIVAAFSLAAGGVTVRQMAVAVIVLGAVVIVVGLLLTTLAVRATLDPVQAVRSAMTAVEEGRLDVEVSVYDGTEIGLLQAGFNRMVVQLRERERLRDLFGRHVGRDVAAAALAGNQGLGGHEREVSVLFVDIIGSTALASERPPAEVVGLLNRFFSVVVEEVNRHGGLVNKFEGDAALAVFGAPTDLEDAPGRCLRAARTLCGRLSIEVRELDAAVGVAAGRVVAGNIGAEERFEYTVIGDAVNEASRLTELAKGEPGRLLASGSAVRSAGDDEAARWVLGESVVLRGRNVPTSLARPVPPA